MAATDNMLKGGLWTGLAVGAALMLGPVLVPALGRLVKPAAKSAIKAGIVLYDRGRETAARMAELAEDVVAEARAEMAEEAAVAAEAAADLAEDEASAARPGQPA